MLISGPSHDVQLDHSIVANGIPQDLASSGLPATVTADTQTRSL
jgi:hypothetical protein